ncbi:chlorite dismutase family protein, partial [Actinomyces sp. 186855]|nr:chlorite dismutase family protein [Actinomyces sp. 186855]
MRPGARGDTGTLASRRPGTITARVTNGGDPMSYALLAAYTLTTPLPPLEDTRRRLVGESQFFVDQSEVTTRGWYDISGFSTGADLLVWWADSDPERLQDAAHRLRASALGHYLAPAWSTIARGDLE